jgi:hypothetical protein
MGDSKLYGLRWSKLRAEALTLPCGIGERSVHRPERHAAVNDVSGFPPALAASRHDTPGFAANG